VYGSPRIHAELKERGLRCGSKRIARLMRERGLCAKVKRRRVVTTDSCHSDPVAPNLLHQEFTASEPDKKWLTDITAVWTAEGWLSPFGHHRCVLAARGGLVHGSAT
jgi:transposase InsO family protein